MTLVETSKKNTTETGLHVLKNTILVNYQKKLSSDLEKEKLGSTKKLQEMFPALTNISETPSMELSRNVITLLSKFMAIN